MGECLMGLGLSFTRLNVMKMNGDDGSQHYQFSSVAQSCPTLCDPTNRSTPASLSITKSWSLLKLMSIESDAIQPAHPPSSPSPPAFNLSQHQGLFTTL